MPLKSAHIRVPASTSNLGAGFDCLGLALDRYLDVTFTPRPGGLRIERAGTLAQLDIPIARDGIAQPFVARLRSEGIEPSGTLSATSTIPIGRGLGSSAAATVAGLALAAVVRRLDFNRDSEFLAAAEIEGHPDNAAPAIYGGLVAVAKEDDHFRAFPLTLSDRIAFAWAAPAVEVATRAARAALPAHVSLATAVDSLSRVAALVRGLATGEPRLLRIGFADSLHVPHRIPLIPRADEAMAAAREAGACAVTVSGSGSGLIAVCSPGRAGEVARAMGEAFGTVEEGVVAFAARPDHSGARGLPV
ncbi:MAG: homoserine kinase [Longimicrobiales bacterium]